MNIHATPKGEIKLGRAARQPVADCDLHPVPNSIRDLFPYMEKRWRDHLDAFGSRRRQGIYQGPVYPKGQPDAARRDAWPPGGRPGSSLAFMQEQHLDPNAVELGVLTVINPHPGNYQNPEQSIAMCRAVNDWQVAEWIGWDRILYASDYPHWDFDDPAHCLPGDVSDENRQKLFLNNALSLYGLDRASP